MRVSPPFSAAVRDAHLSGVTEMIPAYASLLIKYDPFLTDYAALADRLRELERHISSSAAQEGRIVDIPVCYGGKYGEDLPFVARHAGLSEKDVIALHAGRTYRIYMLGFLPGFPYLGGLDSRLFTPRLDTPRTSIPAGSVGIGGQQTGIYPMESPGGWQLIGRTPLTLFSPSQPLPYAAGDRLGSCPSARANSRRFAEKRRRVCMALKIVFPGPLTTVQDFGRLGHQAEGFPECGACDKYSLALANLLAGNGSAPNMAGLEYTLAGPTVQADDYTLVALAAAFPAPRSTVRTRRCLPPFCSRRGDTLEIGALEKRSARLSGSVRRIGYSARPRKPARPI